MPKNSCDDISFRASFGVNWFWSVINISLCVDCNSFSSAAYLHCRLDHHAPKLCFVQFMQNQLNFAAAPWICGTGVNDINTFQSKRMKKKKKYLLVSLFKLSFCTSKQLCEWVTKSYRTMIGTHKSQIIIKEAPVNLR